MKKLSLIITLLLAVLLLQKCRKDTITESATSTNTMFAIVNDSTWSADTIQASLTYNSATKTKVFTFTGIADNKKVYGTITANNAINTASFPLTTFNADSSGTIGFSYYTAEKISGVNTFFQQGTVGAGDGTIQFTAIDSTKRRVTGTFSFKTTTYNYDSNGNVTLTVNLVADGAFNRMPYTFTSN